MGELATEKPSTKRRTPQATARGSTKGAVSYGLHFWGLLDASSDCRIIVALQYRAMSHPGILYTINHVCQYMHKPAAISRS